MKRSAIIMTLVLAHFVTSAQVPKTISTLGLRAYFGFNSDLRDESGNGTELRNNGVVFEETHSISGTATSARFNGAPTAAKYLEAKDPLVFRQPSYSYYVRFKVNEFRPINNGGVNFFYQSILAFCPPNWSWGPAYTLMLYGLDNSSLAAGHWLSSKDVGVRTDEGEVQLDEWRQVVVTYSNKRLQMFLDGNKIGETLADLSYDNQVAFIIGGRRDESDGQVLGGFSGNIDEFAFWDRALSDREIATVFGGADESECTSYQQVAAIKVDTRNESTWSSPVLEKGVRYRVTGKGVWTPNGGYSQADCEYEYFDPCSVRNKSGGLRLGLSIESALSDDEKLRPRELSIDCDSHTYHYDVVGDGRPLYVLFRDVVVADNNGTIDVTVDRCITCTVEQSPDSILGYRKVETHQVVTYALRNRPELSYKWTATGGYLLGPTTNHFCDVIWGFDKAGSVCCIVSDSTCTDTICVQTTITEKNTVTVDDITNAPSLVVRPNPVSDVLQIDSRADIVGSTYDLIDVTGRRVLQAQGPSAQLSLVSIAEGVYHVVHRDAAGTMIGMQRVVVRR